MPPPILFITRKWRGIGGMQRYAKDLCRALEEGHEGPVVICAAKGRFSFLWFPLKALRYGFRLRRTGVHVHLGDCAILPVGVLLHKFWGLRISVMTNGLDVFYGRAWYQWMLRTSLPCASVIVCPSKRLEQDVVARGASPASIRRIPYGIWPEECERVRPLHMKGELHLLTVGRLIPRKGVLWFLREVFPSLLERHPGARYSIIGDGPDARSIARLIRERGWQERVNLRSQEEREQAFAEADIFVMPNIDEPGNGEGLPIVCLEAPARGVPVIASALPGIGDAVEEGVTGTFFPPDNIQGCIDAIERIARAPLDSAVMRAHILRHHAWPQILKRYEQEVFSPSA
jgi:phosphatidyl-myo-inositol dimannoside synthase